MKKIYVSVLIIIAIFCLSIEVIAFEQSYFNDVTEEHYEYIGLLKNMNIISGYEDGTFRGDKSVTRAEFISMVFRGAYPDEIISECMNDETLSVYTKFSDLTEDSWFLKPVIYLSGEGGAIKFINGYPDGTFRPDNNITLSEAYVICVNMLGYGAVAEYHGSYPAGYSYVAELMGLNEGIECGPGDNLTRYDVCRLIYNSFDVVIPFATRPYRDNKTWLEIKNIDRVYNASVSVKEGGYLLSGEMVVETQSEGIAGLNQAINTIKRIELCEIPLNDDLNEYVGETVTAYVRKTEGGQYELVHIYLSDKCEPAFFGAVVQHTAT